MQETDVELAIRAAQAGADVVRSMYGGQLERYAKLGSDFATDADVAAERAIVEVLRNARPDDGFLGEELGEVGPAVSDRIWLVDPICGTLNYAARTPLVATNVALRLDGCITVAAVADPFSGELFWTDGEVARVRSGGRDRPLEPDAASGLVEVNVDPPYPNRDRFLAVRMLQDVDFTAAFRPRVLSTTLPLVWVADGRRAAYVTDGCPPDSVHFSSGITLCRAAGCSVTGLAGQPVHTGVRGLVAASDADVHAELVGIIAHQLHPSR